MVMGRARIKRRSFLQQLKIGGLLGSISLPWLIGCEQKKNPADAVGAEPIDCNDTSSVSAEDKAIRLKLGYVSESPMQDNHCSNCNLFLPGTAKNKCGGCMLFKGPVQEAGYCTYWAPRV